LDQSLGTESRALDRGEVEHADGRHVDPAARDAVAIDEPEAVAFTRFGGWRAWLALEFELKR
jgi:hypothetical protein